MQNESYWNWHLPYIAIHCHTLPYIAMHCHASPSECIMASWHPGKRRQWRLEMALGAQTWPFFGSSHFDFSNIGTQESETDTDREGQRETWKTLLRFGFCWGRPLAKKSSCKGSRFRYCTLQRLSSPCCHIVVSLCPMWGTLPKSYALRILLLKER